MHGNKGFTLIEIIVAVALVAILSAAIAPSVLNNIAQGRVARAQSDVQAIGSAIMRFKNDTGVFPRLIKADSADYAQNRFGYLASLNGNWPQDNGTNKWGDATSGFTTTAQAAGATQDFNSHLILGKSRGMQDSLYVRATKTDDPNSIGFRSSLISSDQADPWGNKYISNVRVLGVSAQPVWVISAGPNGIMESPIGSDSGGYAPDTLRGDDIGFRVQ